MAFRIEELTLGDSSAKEQERTRKVFLSLVKSAHAGEKLTEHEKEFLFTGLTLSLANDGSPDQFTQCDNPKFKWLVLVYFDDLTGGKKFYKPSLGKGQDPTGRLREVSIPEAKADLQYLIDRAEEFDDLILKNQSDQLLQETIVETRRALKELDKQPDFTNDPYFRGRFLYRYPRWKLLIRAKWIYHVSQEIFETQDNKPYILVVNGEDVEINEYSLIHITYRHFVQMLLDYNTGKSFHNHNFKPRVLGAQLNSIFVEIGKRYKMARIDKIFFIFQGTKYAMWISDKIKHVKGKQIPYKRLETFYPVTAERELDQMQNEYKPIQITNEITIYEKL